MVVEELRVCLIGVKTRGIKMGERKQFFWIVWLRWKVGEFQWGTRVFSLGLSKHNLPQIQEKMVHKYLDKMHTLQSSCTGFVSYTLPFFFSNNVQLHKSLHFMIDFFFCSFFSFQLYRIGYFGQFFYFLNGHGFSFKKLGMIAFIIIIINWA